MNNISEKIEKSDLYPNAISGAAGGASITSLLTSSILLIGLGAIVAAVVIVLTLLSRDTKSSI